MNRRNFIQSTSKWLLIMAGTRILPDGSILQAVSEIRLKSAGSTSNLFYGLSCSDILRV